MRLKIAKILPLAFVDTSRQIQCAERNDPERLSKLYLRFGSILKRIREKRGLTIQGLSVLSALPEELLEGAESGSFQITDPEMKDLREAANDGVCLDLTGIVRKPLTYVYPRI
jgi:hypothetical protein